MSEWGGGANSEWGGLLRPGEPLGWPTGLLPVIQVFMLLRLYTVSRDNIYYPGPPSPNGISLLLERGADPALRTGDGCTPLMEACRAGFVDCVKRLLSHEKARATIDCQMVDGITALYYACYGGHDEAVRLLVDAGANLSMADKGGFTSMQIAKRRDHSECVAIIQVSGTLRSCSCWFILYT